MNALFDGNKWNCYYYFVLLLRIGNTILEQQYYFAQKNITTKIIESVPQQLLN